MTGKIIDAEQANQALAMVAALKPKKKKSPCTRCSYQHYDEEGGTFCGLAMYSNELGCPVTGGLF